MVFNTTFNNISTLLWPSGFLVEETGVPGESHRPVPSHRQTLSHYIPNLVCYTYFHWFLNPECQHIFGKQTGYIFQSPKTIKTWTTKHYASLNQWYNTE